MIGTGGEFEKNIIPNICENGLCTNKATHVAMFTHRPFFICEKCKTTYSFIPIITLNSYKKDIE